MGVSNFMCDADKKLVGISFSESHSVAQKAPDAKGGISAILESQG